MLWLGEGEKSSVRDKDAGQVGDGSYRKRHGQDMASVIYSMVACVGVTNGGGRKKTTVRPPRVSSTVF